MRGKQIFLWTISFIFICSICYADNYYINNEGGDDSNGGTSWNDAFESLDPIFIIASASPPVGDNVYIKATGTPYRKGITSHGFLVAGGMNYYFDATGNPQNPTERGTNRAMLYGSRQVPAGGWVLLTPPSSPVKIYYAESPFKQYLFPGGDILALYIDGVTPQKIESVAYMQNNQYYLLSDKQSIYYRNDTVDPSSLPIEWVAETTGIEGSEQMRVYGANLRYFNHGYSHGTCAAAEIADIDVGYSGGTGVIIAAGFADNGIFRNISSHHNGGDGIHIKGYNGNKVFNSVSYANAGDGFVLSPKNSSLSFTVGENCDENPTTAFVTNNTSFNNDGVGFRIYSSILTRWGAELCTTWIFGNNISSNNLSGEFFLEDTTTEGFFYSNGWNGSSNQLFTDNSFWSYLENIDPMFADPNSGNFHLMPGSPYIDSGINILGWVIDDFDGELRDINQPDIGADEYVTP